jgi:hypothetical protein
MHFTLMSPILLLVLLFLGLAKAFLSSSIRRQSDGVSIKDFCFAFQLIDSTLHAKCVSAEAIPVVTSVDLNRCLVNNHGALTFDSRCGRHICIFLRKFLTN